jgi:hypothetical protein
LLILDETLALAIASSTLLTNFGGQICSFIAGNIEKH